MLKKYLKLLPITDSLNKKRILIAKTTHVGDVVITLPMAGIIKYYYPECQVLFLAKGPGCDIARRYHFIDEVYDEKMIDSSQGLKTCEADIFIQVNTSKRLAKAAEKAEIPIRIGSIYRLFNWHTCTHLAMISRGFEKLNKRQLDLEYLKCLSFNHVLNHSDFTFLYQFSNKTLPSEFEQIMEKNKFKLILHPTLITAKNYQWPLDYYRELIEKLDPEKYQIFITGIKSDREYLQPLLQSAQGKVVDMVGKMSMDDFITFIQHSDGLVAGSTGPLHLAAALGIHALGIYRADKSYIKRWEAIGLKAETIAQDQRCRKCPSGTPCQCILSIQPEQVKERIVGWSRYLYQSYSGASSE